MQAAAAEHGSGAAPPDPQSSQSAQAASAAGSASGVGAAATSDAWLAQLERQWCVPDDEAEPDPRAARSVPAPEDRTSQSVQVLRDVTQSVLSDADLAKVLVGHNADVVVRSSCPWLIPD
jgi:hypothetical protein